MSFVEFVGMVLGVAAMIFLVLKHFFSIAQQRRDPVEYARTEKQRQEALSKMLKPRGAVQPVVKKSPPVIQSQVNFEIKPAENYEVIRVEKISQGNRLISSLKSPRDMLILKEILDKPLSLRE